MAYSVMLLVHSYLRWLVLIAGVVMLVRSVRGMKSGIWSDGDNRAQLGFVSVLDIQLLLGLVLYFVLSPITVAFLANPKASMKIAQLRFFGMEHITMMLIAIILVHVARARGKRMDDGKARHRLSLITTLVWLVLTVASIPWPGMQYGRPLFR
jgi:hypothetical protein